jgi:hypothetical protein
MLTKLSGLITLIGWAVTGELLTGYRSTGIEAAGALHRLSYGT